MRSPAASRVVAALSLTVSIAACSDAPTAPTGPDAAPSAALSSALSLSQVSGIPTGKFVVVCELPQPISLEQSTKL